MRYLAWILALILLPAGSQAAAPDPAARGINELLESAQLWQTRGRPDLARSVLQKVLAVRADEPRALLLLGEIDLRSGRKDAALPQLAILQARHPGSAELTDLQQLASLYTSDLVRLTRLQQLREAGRNAEAAALARQIFPSARPPGLWGVDLAGLIASTPGGWEVSRKQAEERVAAGNSAMDRLALAEVLVQNPQTRTRGWALFDTLARAKQLPPDALKSSWQRAIRLQPRGVAVGPLWAALGRAMGAVDAADATALGNSVAAVRADAGAPKSRPAPAPPGARELALQDNRQQAQKLLDAGANDWAEQLLETGLAQHGDDGASWGLLGLARMRLSRHAEAVPAFEHALQLDPDNANRWRGLRISALYWATVRQARDEAQAGRVAEAADRLRPVLDTEPDEVEATLLMASLETRLDQPEAALRHYAQVLKKSPREARAWRGRFDLRVRTAPEEALDEVALFGPTAAELIDTGAVRDQADARRALHRDGSALRLLEQAIERVPADPWLRHDAARIYLALGLPGEARALMAEGRAQPGSGGAMLQASAVIALAADEHDLAVDLLAKLPPAEASDGQRELARRARLEQALARARSDLETRRVASAQDWLDTAQPLIDDSAEQRMRVARLRLVAGQPVHALALLKPVDTRGLTAVQTESWAGMMADAGATELALDTVQARLDAQGPGAAAWSADERAQVRLLHAELALDAKLPQAARLDFQTLATELPPQATEPRLRLLGLQRRSGDLDGARATLAGLMLQNGADPAVRIEAARFARLDDNEGRALSHLRVARDRSAPGSESAIAAQRAMDAIESERQPLLEFALHQGSLDGTPGRSQFDSREATLRLTWPGAARGNYFAQLDLIRLDAGALAAPLAQSGLFGRVLAQAGPAGLAAPSPQDNAGAALGLGWSDRNNSVDVGVVALRVRNVVGGWSHSGLTDSGYRWSLELSRRLLTGSLLSMAGARDPTDGTVWGGVLNNAVAVRAERALSDVDTASASLRFGVLEGKDVMRNQMAQLRAGVDHDLLRADDQRLRIGLSASSWRYAHNLSFHTFGHGGYYSPQRYVSIGVPLEAAGMNGRLSYLVRASLSQSWTRESDAPYYPTDPAAQAATGNPVHRGGPGGGVGASLRTTLEWRAAPFWAVGASFAIERSTDYTPARAAFYVRHWLGRLPAPIDWPPSPPTPYVRN